MDLTGILKIYSDSMRSEYKAMFINGGEIFTVVDYHNNRLAVAMSPMTSVIGWIENTYGIEDLSELKGKEIRFYKDSMYTLNEEMLIEKEFINKSFKTLSNVKDKTTKEWIIKAISRTDEFKEFTECLDISQFLSEEERDENDNSEIRKEQLVKCNVSDIIINLDGKEEIINTVGSQILDINYNRTLFAIEFYGEFDTINNIIKESNKGNYLEFKVMKRDVYSNTDFQFVKEDKEELGNMGLVKYYSHKICDNPGYNCKHIVVFGKSADWYSIKEDEIRYLIDRLNNK